jgi:hypothetical protein
MHFNKMCRSTSHMVRHTWPNTYKLCMVIRVVSTGAFCVRCPVRDVQKRRWILFSERDRAASELPFSRFYRAIAYVMAHIHMFGRQICTITDGETDALVEMIQAQLRMAKRIYLRFCASRTGRRTQKAPVETTLFCCGMNFCHLCHLLCNISVKMRF